MICSNTLSQPGSSSPTQGSPEYLSDLISHWTSLTFDSSQIPSLAENVASAELEKQYYGIIGLNKLLLQENIKSEIETIVNSGVIPSMISLMKGSFQPKMKKIAASCLERLCLGASEQILLLIDNGILQEFLDVLNKEVLDLKIVRCSLWGLINLSIDSVLVRDMILEQNGVEAALKTLENFPSLGLKNEVIIAFSFFLLKKPVPYFPLIKNAIPWLCDYLETGEEDLIFPAIISSLVNISSDKESLEILLNENIISKLVKHIAESEESVKLSCLEVIINIIVAKGKIEEITEILKEKRLVLELFKVIDHSREEIRIWSASILSLFALGTECDLEIIIDNSDFVEKLIKAVNNEKESAPKQMTVFCLSNLARNCSADQIIEFFDNGIFDCLIDLLDEEDENILEKVLGGINSCLAWGKKLGLNDENGRNRFLVELENKGGIEKIKALLLKNKINSGQVEKIWEDYFDND